MQQYVVVSYASGYSVGHCNYSSHANKRKWYVSKQVVLIACKHLATVVCKQLSWSGV